MFGVVCVHPPSEQAGSRSTRLLPFPAFVTVRLVRRAMGGLGRTPGEALPSCTSQLIGEFAWRSAQARHSLENCRVLTQAVTRRWQTLLKVLTHAATSASRHVLPTDSGG